MLDLICDEDRRIKSKIVIERNKSFKVCYDDNPEQFIFNYISEYLNRATEKDVNTIVKFVNDIDFELLFGERQDKVLWKEFASSKYFKLRKNKKHSFNGVSKLELSSLIKNLIPAGSLFDSKRKYTLLYSELSYILKTITSAIVRKRKAYLTDYCILSSNYFLKPGYSASYKKTTGKTLTTHKLAFILRLLDEAELIVKVKRWGSDRKQKPNMYRLGAKNKYKSK